jgi:hypothetical protein
MKLQLTHAALLSVWLWAAPWSAPAQEQALRNPKPNASAGTFSIATAIPPEEHFHLAKYFRDLAAQELALAKSYERMAKVYKDKSLPSALDPAVAREIKNQYRRLADTEKRAAEAAATVAAYHARMAEFVERIPVEATKQANPQDSAFRR